MASLGSRGSLFWVDGGGACACSDIGEREGTWIYLPPIECVPRVHELGGYPYPRPTLQFSV